MAQGNIASYGPSGKPHRPWISHPPFDDPDFGHWLAGFIDGEGHFRIKRHVRGSGSCGFQLKLRRDDLPILEEIRDRLRIGTIFGEKGWGNAKPLSTFLVQSRPDCQRLVDLLDVYPLRAKKRRDYAIWAEAVCEWTTRRRGNYVIGRTDERPMLELKRQIEDVRAFDAPAESSLDRLAVWTPDSEQYPLFDVMPDD